MVKHLAGLSSDLLVAVAVIEQGHCFMSLGVFHSKNVLAVHLHNAYWIGTDKQR